MLRIATALFYLSDMVGGMTAFVDLGIAAHPTKGMENSTLSFHSKHLPELCGVGEKQAIRQHIPPYPVTSRRLYNLQPMIN